jgi:GWxTD domain-containing protein
MWAMAATACGQWQRVGSDQAPGPERVVPRLFDAASVYRAMGLLAAAEPLPFVASVRFLAGPTPDTALAVVGVSLANNALAFRRSGDLHEARYRVEIAMRREGRILAQHAKEEAVRVSTFQETQRADESVVYQDFLAVPPGAVAVSVAVRDQYSSEYGRVEGRVDVPRYAAGTLSVPIPVYRAATRTERAASPDLVVNPRAAAPYGTDTLKMYLETYGAAAGSVVSLSARIPDQPDRELWRDSATVPAGRELAGWLFPIQPEHLPIGEIEFTAALGADTVRTRALLSFSSAWVVANFDDMLSLLRYLGQDQAISAMREAPPAQRPALWRAFWTATDPNPSSPQHELLETYFQRLNEANQLFPEGTDPGWLTDRGEVFITLGPADEIFDSSSDLQDRTGSRVIRWTYITERLVLDFVDETGFGRFRLTTLSRADYSVALNRIRSR